MIAEPSIANVAAILAVPARANILAALFDGRPLPAGSLAELAAKQGYCRPKLVSDRMLEILDLVAGTVRPALDAA